MSALEKLRDLRDNWDLGSKQDTGFAKALDPIIAELEREMERAKQDAQNMLDIATRAGGAQ